MNKAIEVADVHHKPVERGVEEANLLERHLAGDGRAFEALVQRYKARVYGYIVRSGIPRDEWDDLFQEVFLRIHAAASSYRSERPLDAWVFAITANVVRSWYRRRKVRTRVVPDPDPPARDTGCDSLQILEIRESVAWLERAVRSLPPVQREVVILSCVEQLPHAEIARALGLPVNTVKTHLRRGRLALAAGRVRASKREQREVGP